MRTRRGEEKDMSTERRGNKPEDRGEGDIRTERGKKGDIRTKKQKETDTFPNN